MDNYHLTHDGTQWKLTKQGAQRASIAFGDANKLEATRQSADKLTGSNSSLKIHLVNGLIQEERTYPRSADPRNSKG